ncbi:alpha/beta hydrolase family protein [Paenibacillus sp. Z6-24]
MIYQISYISDIYRVKGYMALPYGVTASVEHLANWLNSFYGIEDLEVLPIACPLRPATRPVTEGTYPVLVYCRGGIGRVGSVRMDWLERFAQHGHIVFAPCYRGAEGGQGRDEFGGADVEDVLSGIRWLSQLPFTNEQRISVMGFSRGSVNAALTTVQSVQLPIHRLILWGGVSDLAHTYEERIDLRRMLKRVVGGSTGKYPERYEARSPAALAERIDCPVLIIHGRQDLQVDFSHADRMIRRLEELDKPYDVQIYEEYGHHMPEEVHKQAVAAMFAWIEQE